MSKLKTAATPIADSFTKMVEETQSIVDRIKHPHAVDLKMEFRSVQVDQSGVPIFSRKTKEAATEIHFATRVTLKG